MNPIDRRHFIAVLAAVAAGAARSGADGYPGAAPIHLIVPYPAGGAADAGARLLAAALQERLKQTVLVDNRPGASGVLGMQAIGQAAPDGYTLMQLSTGLCTAQVALRKFELLKTLVPISLAASAPALLCVPPRVAAKTVAELLAEGRAQPGRLNYGSTGVGSLEHLWCHSFSKAHGLEALHVPFKGLPDAAVALAAGDLQFLALVYPVAAPLVSKGLIRALAVLDTQRHPGMPDLPTLREQGVDAPDLAYWTGIAAPAGTPAPIIELLRREIADAAVSDATYRERIAAVGATVLGSETSSSFARLIERELAWMDAAVKAARLPTN